MKKQFLAVPAMIAALLAGGMVTAGEASAQSATSVAVQAWSTGTIQFVNLDKGYGYINYAGQALFFSSTAVWGNWWDFYDGETVEFVVRGGKAISVHKFP